MNTKFTANVFNKQYKKISRENKRRAARGSIKKMLITSASCCLIMMGAAAQAGGYTKTKYPILLVHGFAGFDNLGGLVGYFHTIPYNLARSGATVEVANVSFVHSSWDRGQQLEEYIDCLGYPKVNIMAHGQGAPTARVAAHFNSCHVASITSIDGINKGSKVADIVRGVIPPDTPIEGGVDVIARAAGSLVDVLAGNSNPQDGMQALDALTTPDMLELNNDLEWRGVSQESCASGEEDVWYGDDLVKFYSWSGRSPVTNLLDPTDAFLGVTSLVYGHERNDGFVSSCSSKMGKVIGTHYSMNHLDAINHLFAVRSLWTNPVSLYRTQANRLKKAGL